MKQRRRRKCLHCGELFHPDARNAHHQRFCGEPDCRRASKAASQRRWLGKAANLEYFRGAANVERVRAWRAEHPGYWRRGEVQTSAALQEVLSTQDIETDAESAALSRTALQDLFGAQPVVLIGLIANLTGSALQEDIARSARRFQLTVADAEGLSFYGDGAIAGLLGWPEVQVRAARAGLVRAGLVAFQAPLYQVLSLDAQATAPTPPGPRSRPAAPAAGALRSLRAILQQAMEDRT